VLSKADRELSIECFSACQAALSGIPHDHCAKYLSHVQAEMCALRGDIQSFRKTWSRYQAHFTGERSEPEWFEAKSVHLLQKIPETCGDCRTEPGTAFLDEMRRAKTAKRYGTFSSDSEEQFATVYPLVGLVDYLHAVVAAVH
jgi:hypothetical protein